jgi:hypothetical protein
MWDWNKVMTISMSVERRIRCQRIPQLYPSLKPRRQPQVGIVEQLDQEPGTDFLIHPCKVWGGSASLLTSPVLVVTSRPTGSSSRPDPASLPSRCQLRHPSQRGPVSHRDLGRDLCLTGEIHKLSRCSELGGRGRIGSVVLSMSSGATVEAMSSFYY